jgi:hypothetical protein
MIVLGQNAHPREQLLPIQTIRSFGALTESLSDQWVRYTDNRFNVRDSGLVSALDSVDAALLSFVH